MPRVPIPARTRRGDGAGARLNLRIDYYRPADGTGDDFGFLHGQDDYGPWEIPFAGRRELDAVLAGIVDSLLSVATEAREVAGGVRASPQVWLKAIGAQGWPVDEIWWDERNRSQGVDFPYRPKSVKPGDLMVLYAAGLGVLIGVAEVAGAWYRADTHPRWPWRVDIKMVASRPASQGIPLDILAGERPIGKSIRQRSHIRLSDDEAAKALEAFGVSASDLPAGAPGT
jgi:hypothetical protein